ncbi:alpha/beta hydrolase [Litoreibacter roseus]|uniref:Lysophospholipase n=1 Tax=Litoreibacter roseus TaxID=2601869 RepID=A0A6N6JIX5_9RHOB|nr:alpha/beta hydrolase [Litoreibacter roseus]GFE65897.1 lysophospholipase [Litoreibacter roseus]
MKTALKWLILSGLLLSSIIALIFVFAPREGVDTEISFSAKMLPEDLDEYLASREARFDDIVPGVQKRIIWAGAPGEKTDLSVIYIHGFSATSEEIRPVSDNVAEALGANLFYTRLAGHGRDGAAMAEPTAGDWLEDTAEALAIGRRLGQRVLVISTSTGGTLTAITATQPALMENVAGLVFISPNFAVVNPAAGMLRWPFVRYWGPLVVGETLGFTPSSEAHEKYWTHQYPTIATVPLSAVIDHARAEDFSETTVPALFVYSEDDWVVSPSATKDVAADWGGDTTMIPVVLGEGDDRFNHVIAGDILSPGQTAPMVDRILNWVAQL